MVTLEIDIETFSSENLAKSGVYRYVEAADFEILLFAYSVDGGEVQVVDLANGEKLPEEIINALIDSKIIKWAFNAQFERICLSRYLGVYLKPESWRCTMVWSAYLGLPLSLEGAAIVTGADKKKLAEGKDLIRYFSVPCKPTKANGGRTRNLPEHDPYKWESFKAYNLRDVEVEIAIQEKLKKFPLPEAEWENFILDQRINDRGIELDLELMHQAIYCDAKVREETITRLKELTGLENPNSVAQMKGWLLENGIETESLNKASVKALLEDAPDNLSKILKLRQLLAKSSVKKYTAMENAVGKDKRARGLIQFYGANRTGRFAGRLIQVQNLPQNHLPDLKEARSLVRAGQFDTLELLYSSVPGVLSQLIRTAFIPSKDHKFIIADFSAIEARVIAWLAGEVWRNEVFATHGKIYEASASQMFNVPIEKITKGSPLRQKGKIAELALGYGGSVGALTAMGALDMGLTEDELKPLVYTWREANPNIVKLWWAVDHAAIKAIKERSRAKTHGITFEYQSGMLFISLPSERKLAYVKPKILLNKFGKEGLTYEGIGATKKWERIESYGPKIVENIVQAISRDLLCFAMRIIDKAGHKIVMHVHDEVVVEAPFETKVEEICALMSQSPSWAEDLVLRADGFESEFYKKD
ncbi:DNA polymerase [Alkalihalobacillus oceani]|uniref:DNA polymerase n=1 Tax=Halalkalibacter oceani TaxID=1653776 RepID=UPI00203BF90A|nr:DNA polymerase [Halalkalibacter oceani]MCM3761056.1 DNA polymerase [Halalkalibacter oceani]